jgi:uroporphyrinogen decarboxylase
MAGMSKEKVIAVMNGKRGERVPVIPQITYGAASAVGRTVQELSGKGELMAEALAAAYEQVGYDGVYAGWESSFNAIAEAMGCTMSVSEEGLPSVAEGLVRGTPDIERLEPPDPEVAATLRPRLETIEALRRHLGFDVLILTYIPGPFTLAGLLCGVDRLMMAVIQDPPFVEQLVGAAADAVVPFIGATAARGADLLVVADPSASSSLISPQHFREFAQPFLHRLMGEISGAGAIPSLHICGNTTPILEQMADAGAKVLELDHLVDLAEATSRVGDRVCLQGNIDPVKVVRLGSPDEVRGAARACLEAAGETRFILSSGCEIAAGTPMGNLRAMVDVAREHGPPGS